MEFNEEAFSIIEKLSKCSTKEQKFFLRLIARSSLPWILLLLERHRKILFMLKSNNDQAPIEIVSYSAIILAAKSIQAEDERLTKLDFKDMTLDEIRDLSIRKAKLFLNSEAKRSRPKRDLLIENWSDVKILKNKGGSYSKIRRFLNKNCKFDVAESTIWSLWQEFEGETKKGEK